MFGWVKSKFNGDGSTRVLTTLHGGSTPPAIEVGFDPFLARYDFLVKINVLGDLGIYPNFTDKRIKGLFSMYSPDATEECDWYEYAEVWLGTYIEHGETFEERIDNQFRLWSPAQLAEVNGIEYDSNNRPVRYNFILKNPNGVETGVHSVSASNMIHIYNKKKAGQIRGKSFYKAAEAMLKQLYEVQYYQGEMIETAALNPLIIILGKEGIIELSKEFDSDTPPTTEEVQEKFATKIKTKPGSTSVTTAKIETVKLDRSEGFPQNGVEPWNELTLLMIAAGLGLSKSTITGDYRGNLAVAVRAIRDHDTKYYKRLQRKVLRAAANWYQAFLAEQTSGDRAAAVGAFKGWSKPGFGALEPEKDAKALNEMLGDNLISHTQVITGWGRDPEEVAEEIERDRELGLKKDSAGSQNSDTEEEPPPDDKDPADEDE